MLELTKDVIVKVENGGKEFEAGLWTVGGQTIKGRNIIAIKTAEKLVKQGKAVIWQYSHKVTFIMNEDVRTIAVGNQERLMEILTWVNKSGAAIKEVR